jgi:hypothetical protein
MLAQFGDDRVGHYLTAMDLIRVAPKDRDVPPRLGIAMDGYPEIASADPLRYDFFELCSRLFLFFHTDPFGLNLISSPHWRG